ncbi:AfsR/SARP family transcriptional regulator [Streptomyces sp. DSM 3412]|uniref:AfsR/SARP family transcriptional regulator n=1 Tax=Streptomyces gottesmaniae TaxID=3075518 RepID=A0ABU2YSA0_9ACTN|nr:AfsR/SARP family transcriptional regulator [Streptomyces sp. DSM 3412]MDT0567202.1 AfsR/SARP family transcriptional regulator [Streptomyces sp. DSM 3412]
MHVDLGVLGPVAAWDAEGEPVRLRGPMHRAVLARLVVARRRVVPVGRLVEDLWDEPPTEAVSTLRTFVAALRRALEPDRPPRARPRLLVTEGPGYALKAADEHVDAWGFEHAVHTVADLPPTETVRRLTEALGRWRGPAYADVPDAPWVRAERARLTDLECRAVEIRAEARLALGGAAEAVPELDTYISEHPWRENGWHLLALALYRSGRQAEALSVVRRARSTLRDRMGIEPGPRLRRLETDLLRQADHLDPGPGGPAAQVWAQAAADYERAVPPSAPARLESTAGLMRDLAVTGGTGLEAARRHRVAAVAAAEQLGDPEITARVIGIYDVPAVWTRSDDPEQADWLVAAAERTLRALPPDGHDAARCRLLATIAVETRGTLPPDRAATGERARAFQAAAQAEQLARRLDSTPLLAFALNGIFMQSFQRAGLSARRDAIGAELIAVSQRGDLVTYEILGHLIRLQSLCAVSDFAGADRHARAADRLAEQHDLPLVTVFTTWFRALRTAATRPLAEAETAYRRAGDTLDGAGMPGLQHGLLPLAELSLRLRHGLPPLSNAEDDWGPYETWVRPLLLVAEGDTRAARASLEGIASPPRDLMFEAMWGLTARAATAVGDRDVMTRAARQLRPAAAELAGAQSGLLDFGPVARFLDAMPGAND